MFRLYDVKLHELSEIRPARPGLLRLHADGLPAVRPADAGDLRMLLLTDLIRRNAERHGWSVIVCEGSSEATDTARAAMPVRAALNLTPPDYECLALPPQGVVDVSVGRTGGPVPRDDAESAQPDPAAGHNAVRLRVHSGDAQAGEGGPAAPPTLAAELLADVTARGLDPLAIRYAFLGSQRRDQVKLTWELLNAASDTVWQWRELVAGWANEPSKPMCAEYWSRFAGALDGDLDTQAALAALRDLAGDAEIPAGSKFETFAAADRVLALDLVSQVGRRPA